MNHKKRKKFNWQNKSINTCLFTALLFLSSLASAFAQVDPATEKAAEVSDLDTSKLVYMNTGTEDGFSLNANNAGPVVSGFTQIRVATTNTDGTLVARADGAGAPKSQTLVIKGGTTEVPINDFTVGSETDYTVVRGGKEYEVKVRYELKSASGATTATTYYPAYYALSIVSADLTQAQKDADQKVAEVSDLDTSKLVYMNTGTEDGFSIKANNLGPDVSGFKQIRVATTNTDGTLVARADGAGAPKSQTLVIKGGATEVPINDFTVGSETDYTVVRGGKEYEVKVRYELKPAIGAPTAANYYPAYYALSIVSADLTQAQKDADQKVAEVSDLDTSKLVYMNTGTEDGFSLKANNLGPDVSGFKQIRVATTNTDGTLVARADGAGVPQSQTLVIKGGTTEVSINDFTVGKVTDYTVVRGGKEYEVKVRYELKSASGATTATTYYPAYYVAKIVSTDLTQAQKDADQKAAEVSDLDTSKLVYMNTGTEDGFSLNANNAGPVVSGFKQIRVATTNTDGTLVARADGAGAPKSQTLVIKGGATEVPINDFTVGSETDYTVVRGGKEYEVKVRYELKSASGATTATTYYPAYYALSIVSAGLTQAQKDADQKAAEVSDLDTSKLVYMNTGTEDGFSLNANNAGPVVSGFKQIRVATTNTDGTLVARADGAGVPQSQTLVIKGGTTEVSINDFTVGKVTDYTVVRGGKEYEVKVRYELKSASGATTATTYYPAYYVAKIVSADLTQAQKDADQKAAEVSDLDTSKLVYMNTGTEDGFSLNANNAGPVVSGFKQIRVATTNTDGTLVARANGTGVPQSQTLVIKGGTTEVSINDFTVGKVTDYTVVRAGKDYEVKVRYELKSASGATTATTYYPAYYALSIVSTDLTQAQKNADKKAAEVSDLDTSKLVYMNTGTEDGFSLNANNAGPVVSGFKQIRVATTNTDGTLVARANGTGVPQSQTLVIKGGATEVSINDFTVGKVTDYTVVRAGKEYEVKVRYELKSASGATTATTYYPAYYALSIVSAGLTQAQKDADQKAAEVSDLDTSKLVYMNTGTEDGFSLNANNAGPDVSGFKQIRVATTNTDGTLVARADGAGVPQSQTLVIKGGTTEVSINDFTVGKVTDYTVVRGGKDYEVKVRYELKSASGATTATTYYPAYYVAKIVSADLTQAQKDADQKAAEVSDLDTSKLVYMNTGTEDGFSLKANNPGPDVSGFTQIRVATTNTDGMLVARANGTGVPQSQTLVIEGGATEVPINDFTVDHEKDYIVVRAGKNYEVKVRYELKAASGIATATTYYPAYYVAKIVSADLTQAQKDADVAAAIAAARYPVYTKAMSAFGKNFLLKIEGTVTAPIRPSGVPGDYQFIGLINNKTNAPVGTLGIYIDGRKMQDVHFSGAGSQVVVIKIPKVDVYALKVTFKETPVLHLPYMKYYSIIIENIKSYKKQTTQYH